MRAVLGPMGCEHAGSALDGGVLAAVRLALARLPAPPGWRWRQKQTKSRVLMLNKIRKHLGPVQVDGVVVLVVCLRTSAPHVARTVAHCNLCEANFVFFVLFCVCVFGTLFCYVMFCFAGVQEPNERRSRWRVLGQRDARVQRGMVEKQAQHAPRRAQPPRVQRRCTRR